MAGSSDLLSAVDEFVDAARSAAEAVPSRSIEIAPGGVGVRITLVGQRVIDELAGGLLVDSAVERLLEPELEYFVFDSTESGVRPPRPPWPPSAFGEQRPEIAGFAEPPRIALFDVEYSTLFFYDEDAGAGVQWIRDSRRIGPGEGGAPLRNLLRWGLAAHDLHFSHLATVGGVLLGGAGGAGKSTTSLVCALAGMPFTADDFSAFRLGAEPTSHAVFAYAKANEDTLALIPGLREFGRSAGIDWHVKHRLNLSERIVPSQKVRAIVLPKVAAKTGSPVPVRPAEALRRLTSGSLIVMQGGVQRSLTALRELVEVLPAYELEVGPDIEAIPHAVAAAAEKGS